MENCEALDVVEGEVEIEPAGEPEVATAPVIEPVTVSNGPQWVPVEPAISINTAVSFMASCTFDISIFGKAVI